MYQECCVLNVKQLSKRLKGIFAQSKPKLKVEKNSLLRENIIHSESCGQ